MIWMETKSAVLFHFSEREAEIERFQRDKEREC